jgi:acyl-CoA thioester hydrolase
MPFVHREPVRFRDLDSVGHVNNAVYLTYLEEARIAFVAQAEGEDPLGMIVARIEIDFRSPAGLGDTIEVSVIPGRVGETSFTLHNELRAGDRLVAEASTVLVAYDYEQNEPRAVPEAWRKLLAR